MLEPPTGARRERAPVVAEGVSRGGRGARSPACCTRAPRPPGQRLGGSARAALNYVSGAVDGSARRGLGRGHLLRIFFHRAEPVARAPRLRRHRVPDAGRRGAVRGARSARSVPRAPGDAWTWMRSPCLGHCERARGAPARGRAPPTSRSRPSRRRARDSRSSSTRPRATAQSRPSGRCLRRGRPATRSGCCAVSAASIPGSLDDYRANGGYLALRRAVEIGPERSSGR